MRRRSLRHLDLPRYGSGDERLPVLSEEFDLAVETCDRRIYSIRQPPEALDYVPLAADRSQRYWHFFHC